MNIRYNISMVRGIVIPMLCAAVFFASGSAVLAKEKNGGVYPKSYKVVVPGVLTRSGAPTMSQMKKLRSQGTTSIVKLITTQELAAYKKSDPTVTAEFRALGLRQLSLPIRESYPPTEAEAKRFLSFVKNPKNQPVHVYCRKGHARTGTMVAVYRYSVQGWSMAKAIKEAKRYGSGPSTKQITWLKQWAKNNAPGSYK